MTIRISNQIPEIISKRKIFCNCEMNNIINIRVSNNLFQNKLLAHNKLLVTFQKSLLNFNILCDLYMQKPKKKKKKRLINYLPLGLFHSNVAVFLSILKPGDLLQCVQGQNNNLWG